MTTKIKVSQIDGVGTDPLNLVQLDEDGKLPAVDGSQLTGVGGASAWDDITGKPSFAPVATTGAYGDLSGTPNLALKADLTGGKVPTSQLPDAVLGALRYQSAWNANTNSPTMPAAGAGNRGYYYVVSVAGTTTIDGVSDWGIGDWLVSNGTVWQKIDNTDADALLPAPPSNADNNLYYLKDGSGGAEWEAAAVIPSIPADTNLNGMRGDGTGGGSWEQLAEIASSGSWEDIVDNPFAPLGGIADADYLIQAVGGVLNLVGFADPNPDIPNLSPLLGDSKKYVLHDTPGGVLWAEFTGGGPADVPDFVDAPDDLVYGLLNAATRSWTPIEPDSNPGVPDFTDGGSGQAYCLRDNSPTVWESFATLPVSADHSWSAGGSLFALRDVSGGPIWEEFVATNLPNFSAEADYRFYGLFDSESPVWEEYHPIVAVRNWNSSTVPMPGGYVLNVDGDAHFSFAAIEIPFTSPGAGDWVLRDGNSWVHLLFDPEKLPALIDDDKLRALKGNGSASWSWEEVAADSNPGVPDFILGDNGTAYCLRDNNPVVWSAFAALPVTMDFAPVADSKFYAMQDGPSGMFWAEFNPTTIPAPVDDDKLRALKGSGSASWSWEELPGGDLPVFTSVVDGNFYAVQDNVTPAWSFISDQALGSTSNVNHNGCVFAEYMHVTAGGGVGWNINADGSMYVGGGFGTVNQILRTGGSAASCSWTNLLSGSNAGSEIPVWDGTVFQGVSSFTFDTSINRLSVGGDYAASGGMGLWGGTPPVSQPAHTPLTDSSGGTTSATLVATADSDTNDNFATVATAIAELQSILAAYGLSV